jgi:hypothetical protein
MAGIKRRLSGTRRAFGVRIALPLLEDGFSAEDFAKATKGRKTPAVVVRHGSGLALISGRSQQVEGGPGERYSATAIDGLDAQVKRTPAGTFVAIRTRAMAMSLRRPLSLMICSDKGGHIYPASAGYTRCPRDNSPMSLLP